LGDGSERNMGWENGDLSLPHPHPHLFKCKREDAACGGSFTHEWPLPMEQS